MAKTRERCLAEEGSFCKLPATLRYILMYRNGYNAREEDDQAN